MEYGFQATTNNIYRAQEYVIISDELVAGTITAVGSVKQFQLILVAFFFSLVSYG